MNRYMYALVGAVLGALIMLPFLPNPKQLDKCSVHKVDARAVTAYVLKPPPAAKCEPQIVTVTKECPAPVEAAPAPQEEPRKRRHKRYRRYWR